MSKNSKEKLDEFIQIAQGGKRKMNAKVKRLKPLPPLPINRKEIQPAKEKFGLVEPEFNEDAAYADFLREKDELRKYYSPFLENHARVVKEDSVDIVDFQFRHETDEDKSDFSLALLGKGEWQDVKIPHYFGPEGIWNAFYRTEIDIDKKDGKYYVLDFQGVDYIGEVYVNGRMAGRHVGFFAPFSVNITDYAVNGKNTILVVAKNHLTTMGVYDKDGKRCFGDKIYAATFLGYDEPELGWHHCPAGAGIWGSVKLVTVGRHRIKEIYVRPDIDNSEITVNTVLDTYEFNGTFSEFKGKVKYTLEGRNFKETVFTDREGGALTPITVSENYISDKFKLDSFRFWTPDEPYLYEITVTLTDMDGNILAEGQTHFGMRKFHMDENSTPKGAFYLNNERVIMRGTNEMGHLPRCVMEGNYEQLIDDILIAKVCHLNFYRVTQRPVHKEIYDYFDMLGMMCQSDFPLFSYMRYSVLGDALKQVDEMAKHTRNHPSVVIETFCNESSDPSSWDHEQYAMSKEHLDRFCDAARIIVNIANPDRVIKYYEGDYAPLSECYGISDFHCYTFWYISHGMPSGKMNKGYIPGIRPEWMCGCGEFGTDGLDRWELLKKYAPDGWIPETQDEPWVPNTIPRAQCYGLHGNFFPEKSTVREWIAASREWQREAMKHYVHILRRRVDYIESTAVHLLIDAWPSGWTKTLVDVDRVPKPAYYSFKEANILTRVDLRRDKYVVYENDVILAEIYAFNDLPRDKNVNVKVSVYLDEREVESYSLSQVAGAVSATYMGEIHTSLPEVKSGKVKIVARMECDGEMTYDSVDYLIKPRTLPASFTPEIHGERVSSVSNVCTGSVSDRVIVVDCDYFREHQDELEGKADAGSRLIVFMDKPLNIIGDDVIFLTHEDDTECASKNLVYRSETSPFTSEFGELDFKNFYNSETDYQDVTARYRFDWEGSEEILYTYADRSNPKDKFHKPHINVVARKPYGNGEVILTTLHTVNGCIGCNPVLDKFIVNLIEK